MRKEEEEEKGDEKREREERRIVKPKFLHGRATCLIAPPPPRTGLGEKPRLATHKVLREQLSPSASHNQSPEFLANSIQ